MTFDEFKEYTKAALDLAGDATPETRATIVMTVIQNKHVQMPSDLQMMEEARRANEGAGYAVRASGGAVGGALLPRIG